MSQIFQRNKEKKLLNKKLEEQKREKEKEKKANSTNAPTNSITDGNLVSEAAKESILSPELLKELGYDQDVNAAPVEILVTGAKRKTSEGATETFVESEFLTQAKALSKRARKREEQLKKKAERELKSGEYIAVLKQHEISQSQRDLMTSTRAVGQTLTKNQNLQKLYKRYKFGLPLKPEEMLLLFPNGVDQGCKLDLDEDDVKDSERLVKKALKGNQTLTAESMDYFDSDLSSDDDEESDDDGSFAVKRGGSKDSLSSKTINNSSNIINNSNKVISNNSSSNNKANASSSSTSVKAIIAVPVVSSVILKPDPLVKPSANPTSDPGSGLMLDLFQDGNDDVAKSRDRKKKSVKKLDGAVGDIGSKGNGNTEVINNVSSNGNNSIKALDSSSKPDTKKVDTSAAPTASTSSAAVAGIGSSLLAQLSLFKAKMASSAAATKSSDPTDTTTAAPPANVASNPNSVTSSFSASMTSLKADYVNGLPSTSSKDKPYIAVETPIMIEKHTGQIISSNNESGDNSSQKAPRRATKRVVVLRDPKIEEVRLNLPVCQMEQEIVETISKNSDLDVDFYPESGVVKSDLEANANHVTVICGETGSGKSTQIPQFLYEYGYSSYGMIGITQPRRVAAVSTAMRVASELNSSIYNSEEVAGSTATESSESGIVGYQIRFDSSTVRPNTKIKFMTDGILLREISSDLMLSQYSVVIVDEAHERSVNTDVLLGMLSRSVLLRDKAYRDELAVWNQLSVDDRAQYKPPKGPLKLVVMSATLRVSDFLSSSLFSIQPPLINVTARQFPVTVHFSKRTHLGGYEKVVLGEEGNTGVVDKDSDDENRSDDDMDVKRETAHGVTNHYLVDGFKKVVQIHRRLPYGGILMFLTGKREVLQMCNKLRKELTPKPKKVDASPTEAGGDDSMNVDSATMDNVNEEKIDPDLEAATSGNGDDLHLFSEFDDAKDDQNQVDFDFTYDANDDADDDSVISDIDAEENKHWEAVSEKINLKDKLAVEVDKKKEISDNAIKENSKDKKEKKDKKDKKDKNFNSKANDDAMDIVEAPATATASTTEQEPLKPWILPLFAMMSQKQQNLVFQDPPPGHRLIIVATDVAETSITIPNIRYVVDCGKHKERIIDPTSGVTKYDVTWISKASATQRKGRAGRTGPGHVYCLYSSSFFDRHMIEYQPPEILKVPLEDLILQMRSMGISDIHSFPFPTKPTSRAISDAISLLTLLGAIDVPVGKTSALDEYCLSAGHTSNSNLALESKSNTRKLILENGIVTSLGNMLANFPINPRFSKMLVVANLHSVLALAISMVCILADKSPFVVNDFGNSRSHDDDEDSNSDDNSDDDDDDDGSRGKHGNSNRVDEKKAKREKQRQLRSHQFGDVLARLKAFGAYLYMLDRTKAANPNHYRQRQSKKEQTRIANAEEKFCDEMGLAITVMRKAVELREQMVQVCLRLFPSTSPAQIRDIRPPTPSEEMTLVSIICIGFPDQIAKRVILHNSMSGRNGSRQSRLTGYQRGYASTSGGSADIGSLFIHPHSCVKATSSDYSDLPEFVCFTSLLRNESNTKTYMVTATPLTSSHWKRVPSLLLDSNTNKVIKFSKLLVNPSPIYDSATDTVYGYTTPTYGSYNWTFPPEKRPIQQIYDLNLKTSTSEYSSLGGLSAIGSKKQPEDAYRWFARFLLEGKVFVELRSLCALKDSMKITPSLITDEAIGKEIASLVGVLSRANIISKASLLAAMKSHFLVNKAASGRSVPANQHVQVFLQKEVGDFFKEARRKDFEVVWRRIYNSCCN